MREVCYEWHRGSDMHSALSPHLIELCHVLLAEGRLADDGDVAGLVQGAAKLVPPQGSHDGLPVAGGILGAHVIQQRAHARIGET